MPKNGLKESSHSKYITQVLCCLLKPTNRKSKVQIYLEGFKQQY